MKTILEKSRNGETWKARAVDLAARLDIAQAYGAKLRAALYDSLTSGAKFLCRTQGEYPSDFGSMWYQMRDGTIVRENHEDREVSTYTNMAELLAFYSTLRAAHNIAAYEVLAAVAAQADVNSGVFPIARGAK